VAKERANLRIDFLWLRATLMDFAKADFIEPAGKARDRRQIASDDASIALQVGDVGFLNWEEIESEKRFEERHIVAGDDGGFDVPPIAASTSRMSSGIVG
jgi:hypothetical protein